MGHTEGENQLTAGGFGSSERDPRLQSERGRNKGLDPRERGGSDVQ